MNRRQLLIQLLGLSLGAATAPALARPQHTKGQSGLQPGRPFPALRGPIPLPSDGLSAAQQQRLYKRIELADKVVVPEGYRAELLLSWGDRLGSGRVGFNTDIRAENYVRKVRLRPASSPPLQMSEGYAPATLPKSSYRSFYVNPRHLDALSRSPTSSPPASS